MPVSVAFYLRNKNHSKHKLLYLTKLWMKNYRFCLLTNWTMIIIMICIRRKREVRCIRS